jgi:hypothetical protein
MCKVMEQLPVASQVDKVDNLISFSINEGMQCSSSA